MSTAAVARPIDRPFTLKQFVGNAGLRFHNSVIQLARETGLLTDACMAVRAAAPFAEDELPGLFGDPDSAERVLRWQKNMEEILTVTGVPDPLEFQSSEITDHMMDGKRPAVSAPPPALGADTDDIMAKLGYSTDEIGTLRKESVV